MRMCEFFVEGLLLFESPVDYVPNIHFGRRKSMYIVCALYFKQVYSSVATKIHNRTTPKDRPVTNRCIYS